MKKLYFDAEAKEKILEGIHILAKAVKSTFGPNGKYVLIGKHHNGKPYATKDGVTVAKNVFLNDEALDAGAELIKEAALKQLVLGDGTTTTTILAEAFIDSICLLCQNGETNVVKLSKILDDIQKFALEYIDNVKIPINSIDDLRNIATISSNNDEVIGKLIADAFEKVTKDGVITVDESSNIETTVDTVSGMQIDKGYASAYFCTDKVKNVAILENVRIFLTDQKINRTKDVIDVIEECYKNGEALLIIAEDFDTEVINTLAVNVTSTGLKVCCVKAPSFGEYRVPVLEDIAVFSKGSVATYDNTIEPKDVKYTDLGFCKKVIVTESNTTFMNGEGSQEAINERVEHIKEKLKIAENDPNKAEFLINYHKRRIAHLVGGLAVIYVGGTTDLERGELKDRIEDAVFATKAAVEEGIVIGGGMIYRNVCMAYINSVMSETEKELASSLYAPIFALMDNSYASIEDAQEMFTKSIENPNIGFDAKENKIVDNMIAEGIIDPAKTVKYALMNAISVAKIFLKTNCLIVPHYENG